MSSLDSDIDGGPGCALALIVVVALIALIVIFADHPKPAEEVIPQAAEGNQSVMVSRLPGGSYESIAQWVKQHDGWRVTAMVGVPAKEGGLTEVIIVAERK